MTTPSTSIVKSDFEEFAHENGCTYWDARWLMERLGYKSYSSFLKVINESIGSCMRLGVNVADSFRQCNIHSAEGEVESFKLSRFACYLIAMHADPKKDEVRQMRVYLAAYAAMCAERTFDENALLRVEMRDRLKDGESLMSAVAFEAGVPGVDMGLFKDAGYQGMYNMGRKALLQRRGLAAKDVIYDYMGVVELAANNFRVTQTASRIKSRNLKGLNATSQAAKEVGSMVRREMMTNGGTAPESLPVEENIKQLHTGLRKTSRAMSKLDAKKPDSPKKKLKSTKKTTA